MKFNQILEKIGPTKMPNKEERLDIYDKIIRTIRSCKDVDQLLIAEKMIPNMLKEFHRRGVSLTTMLDYLGGINNIWKEKCKELKVDPDNIGIGN
jgi:hypothetical protein